MQDFLTKVHTGEIIHGEDNRPELSRVTKSMTEDEKERVQAYKGGSSAINSYLRQGKFGSGENPNLEKYASTLQTGLERRVLQEDQRTFIVNRGADYNSLRLNGSSLTGHISPSDVVPGMIFRDHGFESTSIGHGFSGSIRWHLTVPPGVPAAYVGITGGFKGEREVILGRELASICTRVQQDGSETHIWATVVPPSLDNILTGGSSADTGMSSVPAGTLDTFTPVHLRFFGASLKKIDVS